MIKIELIEQQIQPVLSVRTRTKLEDLPDLIGKSYQKIMDYLNELGEEAVGVPFTAYYNLDVQDLDVEMGFPVAKPLPGKGQIISGEIPGGRVVSSMHYGPYQEMEKHYAEITRWISDHGLEATGVAYEYYYNSPEDVPESELLTRIVIPVVD